MNKKTIFQKLTVVSAIAAAAFLGMGASQPATAAIAPDFHGWAYISGRPYANVRACASLGCAIIGRRNADVPVYVVRTFGPWAYIGYGRWVARSLIKPYGTVN